MSYVTHVKVPAAGGARAKVVENRCGNMHVCVCASVRVSAKESEREREREKERERETVCERDTYMRKQT